MNNNIIEIATIARIALAFGLLAITTGLILYMRKGIIEEVEERDPDQEFIDHMTVLGYTVGPKTVVYPKEEG